MQTASSSTIAMDASTHVTSADGQLDGVQIGNDVVLFGRNGLVSGTISYSFRAALGQIVTQYISDTIPGKTYALTGADQTTAIADSHGVLRFTSKGTGSPKLITLKPIPS